MKKLCSIALWLFFPLLAFSQSASLTCASATAISNGTPQGFTSSTTHSWVRFTASAPSHRIVIYHGIDSLVPDLDSVFLYTGTCAGLTPLQAIKVPTGDPGATISATGLSVGVNYYLLATRKPSCSTCPLAQRVMYFYVETAASACTDKVQNGSFEQHTGLPYCISGPPYNTNDYNTYTVGIADHWTTQFQSINAYTYHNTDWTYFASSSDYFNTASGNIGCLNFTPDPRTGSGHAGESFALRNSGLYKEYIIADDGLLTPIIQGAAYVLTYYYKRESGLAINTHGIFFTGSLSNAVTGYGAGVTGIETPAANGWTRVDCNFTAPYSGAMLFGITSVTVSSPTLNESNYFFVDDVSMVESIAIFSTSSTTICQGTGIFSPFQAAGASSYTWSIAPNTATINPSGSTCTVNPITTAGTYTLTVSGTTPGGCNVTNSILIHVLAAPTVSINPAGPITICSGQTPYTLTATASANVSYQWLVSPNASGQGAVPINGATTNTVQVSSTGYYIAQVMNANGCYATAMVHVIVNSGPQAGILASTDEDCNNANNGTVLSGASSGTPPYSYSWNTFPVQTTALATGLDAGSYTVTVTDANGCSSQAVGSVQTIPLPPAPIVVCDPKANLCESSIITYTITNYDPLLSYSASYNINPLSVTQPTADVFVVDWGQNGSDVIFTITIDAASGNRACEQSVSVENFGCCGFDSGGNSDAIMTGLYASKSDIDLYNAYSSIGFVTVSGNTYTYNNPAGTLYIDNSFYVSSGTTLNIVASDVRFGANAAIYIQPNAALNINGSHLAAGCNNMWDGMYIDPLAQFSITNNSLIEDAKHAVVSAGGAPFQIDQSIFNKNRIALDISSYGSAYPGVITNSVITCRDLPQGVTISNVKGAQNTSVFIQDYPVSNYPVTTMLAPYLNVRSYTGVYCNSVGSATIGGNYQVSAFDGLTVGNASGGYTDLNVFDNLDFGVYDHYSNVVVQNNAFQYITGPSSIGKGGQNYGVAVYGITFSEFDSYWVAHVGGYQDGEPNTFYECGRGVDLNGFYDNEVAVNRFETSQVYSPAVSSSLPVVGNFAAFVKTGFFAKMDVNQNDIVNWNTGIAFYADMLPANPGQYYKFVGDAHINDNRVSPTESNSLTPSSEYVRSAIVVQNIIPNCGSCLSISQPGRLYIDNNDLYNVFNGVSLEGWDKRPRIADNQVYLRYQAPYQISTFPQAGIRLVRNNTTVVYRNIINGDAQAINKKLLRGIYATNNTNAPVWCNSMTNVGQCMVFEGSCIGSLIYTNEMHDSQDGFVLLNNGKVGPQGGFPSSANPNGKTCDNYWYGPFSHADTYTDNTTVPNTHSQLFVRGSANPAFIPQVNLTTGNPFLDSYQAPNALNVLFTPAPYVDCSLAPAIAEGGNVEDPKGKVMLMEKIAQDSIENSGYVDQTVWSDKKATYSMLRQDSTLMDTSTVLQSFYADAPATSEGKAVLADEELGSSAVNAGSAINASIVPLTIAEQNLKTVTELYALWVTGQTLTDNQLTTLEAIATQCATGGGEGVYRARTMLDVVEDTYVMYEDSCTPPANSQRRAPRTEQNATVSSVYAVYPNPTSGLLNVAYSEAAAEQVYFTVYDLSGREVLRVLLPAEAKLYVVDLSSLAQGAYQYSISGNSELFKTDRVILTK